MVQSENVFFQTCRKDIVKIDSKNCATGKQIIEKYFMILRLCCIVGRPDPKGLPTFSQCTKFYTRRGFKLMSSRSRVCGSNLWLASQMLV
jgi:hypothetical protein